MSERESICGKIRALRAKTVENGCTEEEAMAAAAKAAEMLARYNLTVDEVELRASPFEQHRETHVDHVGDRLWKVAAGVSELTGATSWKSGPGVHPVEVNFFGFQHEVEISVYLLEICASAMRREQSRILHGGVRAVTPKQRARLYPFLDGMADRLYRRLVEMKPPPLTGKGLVVLRDALIKAAMPVALREKAGRPSRDADEAYLDGLRAGDRVSLNPGLGSAVNRPAGVLR